MCNSKFSQAYEASNLEQLPSFWTLSRARRGLPPPRTLLERQEARRRKRQERMQAHAEGRECKIERRPKLVKDVKYEQMYQRWMLKASFSTKMTELCAWRVHPAELLVPKLRAILPILGHFVYSLSLSRSMNACACVLTAHRNRVKQQDLHDICIYYLLRSRRERHCDYVFILRRL